MSAGGVVRDADDRVSSGAKELWRSRGTARDRSRHRARRSRLRHRSLGERQEHAAASRDRARTSRRRARRARRRRRSPSSNAATNGSSEKRLTLPECAGESAWSFRTSPSSPIRRPSTTSSSARSALSDVTPPRFDVAPRTYSNASVWPSARWPTPVNFPVANSSASRSRAL